MTGKKSSRDKRRKRASSELAAAAAAAASMAPSSGERRKRRSMDSSSASPPPAKPDMKFSSATTEKEVEQPSEIEEGGLDLTVSLKPVSFYISDKKEMLQQCFCVIGERKLQKMLPDVLKNCSIEEIKKLCLEQLELLSEKKLSKILEGDNWIDSDTDDEAEDGFKLTSDSISQQDNSVDSTSSLRDSRQSEGLELKQGKGEDSDVLSINADTYDSDIEGPCPEEAAAPDVPEHIRSGASQIDDLQKDIERSVNEILGLAECSPKETKAAAALTVPPSEDVQPSAQQLELLELEMRARAIKALMKAGDVKKIA
ncbi:caspase activity and apoptosis inhibitor 1 [Tachyglossus aculeatus]|uniref:caspase activity and apoptosis inhibitor 1 n=1 Tax=Tachyglossus aculeatus TaxID=9261 RepID=UPI0018F39579|nr:caspase activity and apoptosis inhibitor 1 [Tachyglossus aculeatus]